MASSHSSISDPLMHKNLLQQYTQKSGLQFPVYETINEGSQHSPQFRSTVLIDGEKFTSTSTFSKVKEAEQNVARHALEQITKRINEGCLLIHKDPLVCKSVLNEIAVKMKLDSPKYTTQQAKGAQPGFVSSLVFNGKSYTSNVSGSKIMAEQLAACNAIQSLLGSGSKNLLNQSIKSKDKGKASLHSGTDLGSSKEFFATTVQPGISDPVMHKNHLQEFTQKSGLQLPVYETINEGTHHAPQFRSTVLIDEEKFTSTSTFSNVKEAGQSIAKYALERITKRTNNEGCPLIHQDPLVSKSVLNGFAMKMKLDSPKYTTQQAKGAQPGFVSSLVFDGKSYTGNVCGSKIMAEQLAAHNAIQSLLGSHSENVLNQIIKSKDKGKASLHSVTDLGFSKEIFATTVQPVSKSVLNEFAMKMKLDSPKYTTQQVKGAQPGFVSSLVFDGKSYTSNVSGSKKMAEQLAARNAIQSLLGSHSENVLNQIIKSKDKRKASLHSVINLGFSKEIFATAVRPGDSSRQPSNVVAEIHHSGCTTAE